MKTSAKSAKKTSSHQPLRKVARKRNLDVNGLSWLLDRELPPQNQLPENPVLYLRRL